MSVNKKVYDAIYGTDLTNFDWKKFSHVIGTKMTSKIPKRLFHYTTASSLRSILAGGKLYATDLAYLNDERELQYGLAPLQKAFIKSLSKSDTLDLNVRELFDNSDLAAGTRMCVTCFCTDDDLLSQWRGYSGGVGGYSIGFRTKPLASILPKNNPGLILPYSQVLYGDDNVKKAVKFWLKRLSTPTTEIETEIVLNGVENSDVGLVYDTFNPVLLGALHACAFLKDDAFKEEDEWRVAIQVAENTIGPAGGYKPIVKFRDGMMGVTPYVELDMRSNPDRGEAIMPIDVITVGPGGNQDLRVKAVELLLKSLGYSRGQVEVKKSRAPYRSV